MELGLLHQCADRARNGNPTFVRLTGAAGIGKTTLVRRFLDDLSDFTALRATASRTRQLDAYGVFSELLSAYRDVPTNPHTAVVCAAAELLDLLGQLQAVSSVVMVVDDVQWADQFSIRALMFVQRRLGTDQVLVLLVSREDEQVTMLPAGDDATRMRLAGFTEAEVAEFVAGHVGGSVGAGAATWMRDQTGGVPLNRAISTWMTAQPKATRRLMEALAVVDTRISLARLGRLAAIDNPAKAVEPAVHAGVVDWRPADPASPVAFSHQLHRDTVYAALPAGRRRRLHQAALPFVGRRASWRHRVAAAADTDESLAAGLEEAAEQELAGGEYEIAANHLLWAAELSGSRAEHERRLLTGCLYSLRDFRTAWSARRSAQIAECAASPLRDCAQGILAMLRHNELTIAEELFTRVLHHTSPDSELAWVRRTAATFLSALHLWRGRGPETVWVARQALADPSIDPRSADMARMTLAVGRSREDGWPVAFQELRHLPTVAERTSRSDLECLALRAMSGQLRAACDDLTVVVRAHRCGFRSAFGNGSFYYLATVQYLLGAWDDSAVTALQGVATAEADEQMFHHGLGRLSAVLVPAGRGDFAIAAAQVRAAQLTAERSGMPQDRRYAAIAAAVPAQAQADHAGMLNALASVRDLDSPDAESVHVWWQLWWRPLLVEALIGTGRLVEAGRQLAALKSVGADVAYLQPLLGRLEGWLLDRRGAPAAARDRYQRALNVPAGDEDPPLYRGMLEASLGALLRRTGAAATAGDWLRAAHGRLAELGAAPFLQRCEAELARCAERTRPIPMAANLARLSEREYQVVRLTQRGMTNREIAAELYLSSKTVEFHLGNVFAKLGIGSRRQLRDLV